MKKFLFCTLAILLNLLGAWCTRFFALPLYLDSISTIAVAYLCGCTPSIAVAAVTNIILVFAFESPLVFTVCHLLTALGAWLVFRFSKKPPIDLFLFAGLLSAATNAISGSVFSLAMFQGQQKTPIAGLSDCLLYITNSIPFALFVSGIVTNLADKILSAMFSYLLVAGVKNCHTDLDCHTDLLSANSLRFQAKQRSNKKTLPVSLSVSDVSREQIPSGLPSGNYLTRRSRDLGIRVASSSSSYLVTTLLILIAIANIIACFVFQKIFRRISDAPPSLDSSLYLLIVTSIVLLAASFLIVYAKMIQVQKEKEVETHRRELSKRMSFDLHDGVLQNLVALKTRMETELYQNEKSPEMQLIQTAVSEIRILCGILRLNDEVPLEDSIQNTLTSYEQTYGFKTKLGIACDISFFTPMQKAEILHILYECLSNTAQHSNAKNVSVTFADDGAEKIYFTVRDDGKTGKRSLDSARDDKSIQGDDKSVQDGELHGLGLKSVEARVKKLGGTVQFLQNEDGWTTRMELQYGINNKATI